MNIQNDEALRSNKASLALGKNRRSMTALGASELPQWAQGRRSIKYSQKCSKLIE